MDFVLKWGREGLYSWLVRKFASNGSFYGSATQFERKVMSNFSGKLNASDAAFIQNKIEYLTSLDLRLSNDLPLIGVISVKQSRKVLATFPTANFVADKIFEEIANVFERNIIACLDSDEANLATWRDLFRPHG